MKGMYVVMLLCFGVPTVLGRGSGAPVSACTTLMPAHTGISPQTSDSPYSIEIVGGATSFCKGALKVKITGQLYGGFLLQLRKMGGTTPLGTWSAPPTGTKLLTCTTADSGMTHSSSDAKESSLEFTWNPPASATGNYEFVATVAETREKYWTGLKSHTLTANCPAESGNGNGGSGTITVFLGVTLTTLTVMALV